MPFFKCLKKDKLDISKNIFREYSNTTTIHGIQFIGDDKRPHCERIFWVIVFLVSLICCSILIRNQMDKIGKNPVFATPASHPISVKEVPYPSFTICPENRFKRQIFNISEYNELSDEKKSTIFGMTIGDLAGQICPNYKINLGRSVNFVDYDIISFIKILAPQFNTSFILCTIDAGTREHVDCTKYLKETITAAGLCYTFNGLAPQEIYRNHTVFTDIENSVESTWNIEDGYKNTANKSNYPINTIGGLFSVKFEFRLNQFEFDFDHLCNNFRGFQLFLHSPSDIPIVSHNYVRIPIFTNVRIPIEIQMAKTSKDLIKYSPEARGCFFNSERQLKFFKIYTESNCLFECLSNYTLRECGCVFFYMPRLNSTPICGAGKWLCGQEAKRITGEESMAKNKTDSIDCNCLPSCTSLAYESIPSYSFDSNTEYMKKKISVSSGSIVTVFLRDSSLVPIIRSELFSVVDLIANFGGILGLFMGFSLLSFAEIIYYCIVPPFGLHFAKRRQLNLVHNYENNRINVQSISAIVGENNIY